MTILKCISPIDGSIYAERETADAAGAAVMIDKARAAQKDRDRPLELSIHDRH